MPRSNKDAVGGRGVAGWKGVRSWAWCRWGGWMLSVWLLSVAVPTVWAVDPLPPELENAPEEKKLAWRKRWAEDSARQKEQVAKQRYAERMAVKDSMRAFQASLREEVAARNAPSVVPAVAAAAAGEETAGPVASEGGGYWGWILAGGIAAAGIWFLRREREDGLA